MTENKYAVPLSDLERSAHVPVGEQVAAQAEPPNPDLLDEADRERLTLLRVASG